MEPAGQECKQSISEPADIFLSVKGNRLLTLVLLFAEDQFPVYVHIIKKNIWQASSILANFPYKPIHLVLQQHETAQANDASTHMGTNACLCVCHSCEWSMAKFSS